MVKVNRKEAEPMKEGYVDNRFASLYYKEMGQGMPLIMLHGNGESHEIFARLSELMSRYYRVILMDLSLIHIYKVNILSSSAVPYKRASGRPPCAYSLTPLPRIRLPVSRTFPPDPQAGLPKPPARYRTGYAYVIPCTAIY